MVKFNTLLEVIINNSSDDKKGITFIKGENEEKKLSFSKLYKKSSDVLFSLKEKGLKKGDELILQFNDNEMFICTFWACILGGIIPVPISVGMADENKTKVIKIWGVLKNPYMITESKIYESMIEFVEHAGEYDIIDEIKRKAILYENISESQYTEKEQIFAEDIALIQFSSGSTGDPKGIVLTHDNLITNINAIIKGSALTSEDICLSWMPLTHDMGLIGKHLTTTVLGIEQYIMPPSLFISKPNLWLLKASQYKATLLSSPSFGYSYFLSKYNPEQLKDIDLSSIRVIYNGAEPISTDLCDRFLSTLEGYGLKRTSMFNVYGMAEASLAVTFPPVETEFSYVSLDRSQIVLGQKVVEISDKSHPNVIKLADVGFSVDNCQVKIIGDSENELAEGYVGHILIKGRNVTKGYYNNENATKESFTDDGWLRTGDLGFMRNNRLIVTGRSKEIIIANGQNYYPHDLERSITEVFGSELKEVAVCRVQNKDEKTDNAVVFAIYKRKLESFIEYVLKIKEHLYKIYSIKTVAVIPVKKIPKTTSGKIQRSKLSMMFKDGEFNDLVAEIDVLINTRIKNETISCPESKTEETLLQICMELFDNGKKIGINDNLLEAGANSIILIQMYQKLEELLPGKLSIPTIIANPTISQLAQFIDGE